jgi:hypothetical protein
MCHDGAGTRVTGRCFTKCVRDMLADGRDRVILWHVVRMHVMGDGSALDLNLRGLAASAAAATLALPPGEALFRSYPCEERERAWKKRNPRGQLYLCTSCIVFDSGETVRKARGASLATLADVLGARKGALCCARTGAAVVLALCAHQGIKGAGIFVVCPPRDQGSVTVS